MQLDQVDVLVRSMTLSFFKNGTAGLPFWCPTVHTAGRGLRSTAMQPLLCCAAVTLQEGFQLPRIEQAGTKSIPPCRAAGHTTAGVPVPHTLSGEQKIGVEKLPSAPCMLRDDAAMYSFRKFENVPLSPCLL